MLDKVIIDFIDSRKQEWLDKEITPKTSEKKRDKLTNEANEKFTCLWLENILKGVASSDDIARLQFTTHTPKFSHPDVRLNAVVFKKKPKISNFLCTGNVVSINYDMYSNSGAAYLKKEYIYAYEFLTSKILNGQTVLEHLDGSTKFIKNIFYQLNIDESFDETRRVLLNLVNQNRASLTSEKIKQIYFPVHDDYHLLSLLHPSPLMNELKARVNAINYSIMNKKTRKAIKEKKPIESNINEIFNLIKIGFGGANKQNISVLNNKHGGYFYLLPSLPPILNKRKIQPPKKSFFDSCLWPDFFKEDFDAFHAVLADRRNNINIRDKRDDIVINSISKVSWLLEQVRGIGSNWSDSETYDDLEGWEKIWLDEKYLSVRPDDKQNNDYINKAQSHFANWFIGSYKHAIKDNKLLGNDDIDHIKEILKQEQELLV